VIELMVYNRFHRILTSVVQKAIHPVAGGGTEQAHLATEMRLADCLIRTFRPPALTTHFLGHGRPEAMVAEVLVQLVEVSCTVKSLADLTSQCGLEIVAPCPNTAAPNGSYALSPRLIPYPPGRRDPAVLRGRGVATVTVQIREPVHAAKQNWWPSDDEVGVPDESD
jgi:hypothetical protein